MRAPASRLEWESHPHLTHVGYNTVCFANMNLESALSEALADTKAALLNAERDREEILARIERLEEEQLGLRLALARHRGLPLSDTPPTSRSDKGRLDTESATEISLPRTEAILRVLGQTQDPLSPGDIVRRLGAMGRTGDTAHNVSAALSYLASTKKQVQSLGRGKWVLSRPPLALEAASSTAPEPSASNGSAHDRAVWLALETQRREDMSLD